MSKKPHWKRSTGQMAYVGNTGYGKIVRRLAGTHSLHHTRKVCGQCGKPFHPRKRPKAFRQTDIELPLIGPPVVRQVRLCVPCAQARGLLEPAIEALRAAQGSVPMPAEATSGAAPCSGVADGPGNAVRASAHGPRATPASFLGRQVGGTPPAT